MKEILEKLKIRGCFMVKFNQINMKCRFLFFVSTKRIHIDSFAQNVFNRCSPVLQKLFWTYKSYIGKKSKIRDHFMVKYNQIIVKNRFLFLHFDKNDTDWYFWSETFQLVPQYSRCIFGPMKEILEKNRKSGIVLWSNSIKST